jgi:hypothetical protein
MVDITIFELNLDGSEFTAAAPWDGEAADESPERGDEDDDSGGPPLGLLAAAGVAAVVVLVVLVVVLKTVRGGEDTDLDVIEDDLA